MHCPTKISLLGRRCAEKIQELNFPSESSEQALANTYIEYLDSGKTFSVFTRTRDAVEISLAVLSQPIAMDPQTFKRTRRKKNNGQIK